LAQDRIFWAARLFFACRATTGFRHRSGRQDLTPPAALHTLCGVSFEARMANPQHVEWFLEGVLSWNRRRKDTDFTPDLSGEDLRTLFEQAGRIRPDERMPLHHANLRGANLEGAKLERANLRGADLNQARVTTLTYSGAATNDDGALYTDLSTTTELTQEQLDSMLGDSGTILPDHLTRPTHWPDWRNQIKDISAETDVSLSAPTPAPELTTTPLTVLTPVVDIFWSMGKLDVSFMLDAREPQEQLFHPPQSDQASMDLLGSLGQMANQIATSLHKDTRINAAALVGDLAGVFEAIRDEIFKPEGMVLSFVIDTNLIALEGLYATNSEALREVDGHLIAAFISLGQRWRKASNILQEIDDPTGSDLVPQDRLDEIEALEDQMIGILTDPANAAFISPSLAGVTRDMALYPWDKDDPERHRRKRAAAFAVLADRIRAALQKPPGATLNRVGIYATLLGTALAIIAFF
jgi:hypothetical protein